MQPLSAPPRLIAPKRSVETYVAVDPAPSVLSYRMQRLWLTPIFRAFVRVGLPAVSILGLVWMFLSQDDNRAHLLTMVQEAQVSVQNQPVHQLQTLTIEGASPLLAQEIRVEFGDLFPVSAFELDLETKEFKNIAGIETILSKRYGQKREDVQAWLAQTKWSQKNIQKETLENVQNKLLELKLISQKLDINQLRALL